MALSIDIGVFAHDEAEGIAAMIAALAAQDILHDPQIDARVLILANGCTDDTVARARAAIAALPAPAAAAAAFSVIEMAAPGKSRCWNRFVHEFSRPGAEMLVFADADIGLPADDCLRRLAAFLSARPELAGASSRPVKDIVHRPEGLSPLDRMIAAAGGGLDDWRTAICGQLYVLRSAVARGFHLPIGLPVEDGFLRALVLTRGFTAPEDTGLLDGDAEVFHIYASERSVAGLIRHQTRLVIGGAVNFAVFEHLRRQPAPACAQLRDAAENDAWLATLLRRELPRMPWGFVPAHFLFKRLHRAFARPRALLSPKALAVLLLGTGFDIVVWLVAQWRMAMGQGAGYW